MTLSEKFFAVGEYFAAGCFEDDSRSIFYRVALGIRRAFENAPLTNYSGGRLYPEARLFDLSVFSEFNNFAYNRGRLEKKAPDLCEIIDASDFIKFKSYVPSEHTVAGNMYTHSMPNYERILKEGLSSYKARIEKIRDGDMREGLLHIICGIECYLKRTIDYLVSIGAPSELIEGLRQVPLKPARNFYEALLCWNFVFHLDGCDNEGCLANGLDPYYDGSDNTDLLREFYTIVDKTNAYSMSIGTSPTPLTIQCINAAHGMRRPMIEFFVDENTPEEEWNAAAESILCGGGSPAIYNKKLYFDGFKKRFPEITDEELKRLCGGGCTEMMIAGLSNVGSLDAGLNLPYLLEEHIKSSLLECESFENFYDGYIRSVYATEDAVMQAVRKSQELRAKFMPAPMRTLLIDDCIDRATEYYAGGARYCYSIISFAGITNVIDSLLSVRDKVFGGEIAKEEFLSLLEKSDPEFLEKMKKNAHRHGINDPDANALGYDFTEKIFTYLKNGKTHYGSGFMPSSILFKSYGYAGNCVGATPDGRRKGEALSDSLGAIFGKDTEGVTELIKSVTALDLKDAIGTPVFNLTITPEIGRDNLKGILKAFIALGGMQIQVSCVSKEVIADAAIHPENHGNLVVRVGGFSEYFVRLDDNLRGKFLERVLYQ